MKYTLKMKSLGHCLTFRNRPWKKQRTVLDSEKEPKKEPVKVLPLKQEQRKKLVKVLDNKTGDENQTESEKLVLTRGISALYFMSLKFI